jgi:hypothetical protein
MTSNSIITFILDENDLNCLSFLNSNAAIDGLKLSAVQ